MKLVVLINLGVKKVSVVITNEASSHMIQVERHFIKHLGCKQQAVDPLILHQLHRDLIVHDPNIHLRVLRFPVQPR